MATLDWVVVGSYCVILIAIGLVLKRKADRSIKDYFISGRSLPWWLAGTSMVATSYASDTPLFVTGLVRTKGVWGNWGWWALGISTVMAIFLFSRFWRRANIVTEVELTELRYDGKSASFLRGFKAIYWGVFYNIVVVGGMVMVGLVAVIEVCVPGVSKEMAILSCCGIALVYATLSGFWGVVVTDFLQFVLAMIGALLLAGFALYEIGGFGELWKGLEAYPDKVRMVPEAGGDFWTSPFSWFLALLCVQWWAWKNTDGGGLLVQRMLSCRNEKHAVYATLWFNIAHYAFRSWPWILVALCSLLLLGSGDIPRDADGKFLEERAYPVLINMLMPVGLKGLLIASFFAAFMSTADTYMNWGSSYCVNDFYKRFVRKKAGEKHYVFVSRLASVLILAGSAGVAFFVDRISESFFFILKFTAGIGMVHLARWFWWRTNAWSELSCMVITIPVILLTDTVRQFLGIPEGSLLFGLLWMVGGTMAVWVPVTFLTRPVGLGQISEFYRRVRPYGFWGPVRRLNPRVEPVTKLSHDLGMWVLGVAMVYSATLGIGYLILGKFTLGGWLVVLSAFLLGVTIVLVRRTPEGVPE